MLILMRRLSRSGVAPGWFYIVVAAGFGTLAVWAFVQHDWLIGMVAAVMIGGTVLGARLLRAVAAANRIQEVGSER